MCFGLDLTDMVPFCIIHIALSDYLYSLVTGFEDVSGS